ncbi:MAG: YncE family protein [Planctomycetota bacterium]|nr:YncE family protein [Planctomycetota bacterium]
MLGTARVTVGIVVFCAIALVGSIGEAGGGGAGKPGDLVIITNWGADSCSLVDASQGKELAKIDVGLKPYDIKVDPTGRYAYLTCSGANYLSIIDLQAMLELKDQRIRVGESPRDIAITRDGKRAVVANSGSDSISVVDLEKRETIYSFEVGSIPYGVALFNNGSSALVTNWGSNRAVLVHLGELSGKIVKSFEVGSLPYTVVVTDDSNYAMISCFGSHKIYVIDLKEGKSLAPIDVGRSPWGLALSRDGKSALVANFYSADASILRVSRRTTAKDNSSEVPIAEIARIPIRSSDPVGATATIPRRIKNVAFLGRPNIAVLSDLGRNEVLVLDITKKEVLRSIAVGKAPYGIAAVPRHDR